MVLKALGGDVRITMYRQKPRIVCKIRKVGVFRRGKIGGVKEVEQGAKNTVLGDARFHFVAVGARVFMPDLEVVVCDVRLQKQVVWAGREALILYSKPVCHTLSNAWATSRKAAVHSVRSSRLSIISLTIRCACCTGEWM